MSLMSNLVRKVTIFHRIASGFSRSSAGMSSMKDKLEAKLKAEFNPVHMDLQDVSGGCGASFTISIVSDKFQGKGRLQQHRAVFAAVKEEMEEIHAFQIESCLTPEQWQKKKVNTGDS